MKLKSLQGQHAGIALLAMGAGSVRQAVLVALAVAPMQSHAQADAPAPADGVLEEVVVSTARQREERLIDVPVAVSSISAQEIERSGMADLESITQNIPQVNLAMEAGGLGLSASIRGVRTPTTELSLEQSVVFNVDGVPISRGRTALQGFFDVERIEVLKGPQALFFGKNASAGVISLASKGPGSELEAYARLSTEFEADENAIDFAIGGPISDAWGARVAVRAREMEGWVENVAGPLDNPYWAARSPEVNPMPGALDHWFGEREFMGRATLAYDPGNGFNATLKVTASQYEDDGATTARELVGCGANGLPENNTGGIIAVDPFADCKLNGRTSVGNYGPVIGAEYPYVDSAGKIRTNLDSVFSSLQLNYDFGDLSLASVTGYVTFLNENGHAASTTVYTPVLSAEKEDFESLSQELRLQSDYDGRFNFMIGGYYADTNLDHARHLTLLRPPVDPSTGRYFDTSSANGFEGKTTSLFGQLLIDLTDRLELTAGARWTDESKDSFLGVSYVNPALVATYIPVGTQYKDHFSDSNISPEVTLTYHFADDAMIYGAYKTGFKSGGWAFGAIPFATLNPNTLGFDSEKVSGYEVGSKMTTDNGLTLTAAVYDYVFSDLQVSAFIPATTSFLLTNAASASTTGIELEAKWQVTDMWSLYTAASYNRSRYDEFPGAPCYSGQTAADGCVGTVQNLAGKTLAQAPDWDVSAGFYYETPLGTGRYRLGASTDVYYTSEYNTDVTLPPDLLQDSFVKFDASVRLFTDDDRYEVALIGRNLSNEWTLASGSANTGSVAEFVGFSARPRQIILQATARF